LLSVGGAILALGVVYAALVAATGDGIPRGATVLGVDIGGQSEAQAAATLTRVLGPRASAEIDVVVGTEHVSVVPADAGLSFDAAATVRGQVLHGWQPSALWAKLTGSPAIQPVIVIDEATLAKDVGLIAADSDTLAQEPTVVLRGTTASLNPGAVGRVLDQAASVKLIAASYFATAESVVLPQVDAAPKVSSAAAAQALALATSAVSGPIPVVVEGISTTIPAAAVAEALSFASANGVLTPKLDGVVLRAAIAPAIASIETLGNDATWDVSSGVPVVVPSRQGQGVDPDQLAADVLTVLGRSGSASRTVTVTVGTVDPKLTTEQALALGVVEQMSSFKQNFPYAAYRVQNIGQAAKRVNGTLLLPGQTFSLNDTIKERTVENGYTVGYIIGPGGVFKEDLGGGVSTSATTVWTAAFFAGLARVHVQAHSIWIPRYREGLEATVAWGSFDMSFRNDTTHAVYITTVMQNTSLTVTMWGTKAFDEVQAQSGARYNVRPFKTVYDPLPTCHAQGGEPGFAIDVYRVFITGGVEVKREKITTNYRPGPEVICTGDPSIPPTGSPTPTPTPTGPVPQ